MQFVNNAPIYKLVRITGPKHNLLVLQFSEVEIERSVRVEALDAAQKCTNPIGAQEVLDSTLRAIEDVEIESGKRYFLEAIQYVASDSHPAEVYYEMTKEIIQRIESQSS
jgi:hypothetical protein